VSGQERRGQAYIVLAAIGWSTTGVLQRGLSLDTATQVCSRALVAGLALMVYIAFTEGGRGLRPYLSMGLAGMGVAVGLAIASGAFIAALNHTTVARVLLVQAISPVFAMLLARVLLGEAISGRTAAAMSLALAGTALMLGAPGDGSLVGDGLAVTMSLAFAAVLVITRHRRDISMAPATCVAQLLLVLAFLPAAHLGAIGLSDDLPALVFLGGQVGVGLVLLTRGARLIPAAQVGLLSLLEVVLGPLWVWLAHNERPGPATLVGGAIVIGAIVVQTWSSPPPELEGDQPAVPPLP
jgi:drug/metabolite transporter (DMT)-like permease